MPIAFDAVVSSVSSTWLTRTYAHTYTWTNGILFVCVNAWGWDLVTGTTYAGVAMTLIQKLKTGWALSFNYVYALSSPTAGANNVVVTASVSTALLTTSTSYTGVRQTVSMDAVATSSITAAALNLSTSLTTIADNCWTLCYAVNDTNVFASNSDTIRGTNAGANIFDSNAPKTPAGAKTMTQTVTGSGNAWVIMISFAPSLPTSTMLLMWI